VGIYTSLSYRRKTAIEKWQSLIHVCRRWRSLILGSPRRLNLKLYCTPRTPARDKLDIWPALPLIVKGDMTVTPYTGNVIAALGQSNRVCYVDLEMSHWQLGEVLAVMQVPFPELTDLILFFYGETPPLDPDSFLGGSAPRLQSFQMVGIPFRGLPKILFFATHLVSLEFTKIPHSGYFSPKAIVNLLSVLSSLETLSLEFQSPQSFPDWQSRRPPPSKRFVIPALITFHFKGVTEYLEDLVACIDTPQLIRIVIKFFNQIDFDIPQLVRFINRTPPPKLTKRANVRFQDHCSSVEFPKLSSRIREVAISCKEPDWQLSSIEQVCNSYLHTLSTAEDLYIIYQSRQPVWKDDAIDNTLWAQLLLPFTAVKNLYLSKQFARGIAAALQELVGGRITEVLPRLQKIFVESLNSSGFRENTGQFVAARKLSGHPIAITVWRRFD
jgi:hypothetical protein